MLRNRRVRTTTSIIVVTVLTILILVLAEFAGWLYLRAEVGEPRPFLIDLEARKSGLVAFQQGWGDELVVSFVDPFLGFAHDPSRHPLLRKLPGFAVYGNAELGDPDAMLVVCLGGSTTDPLAPLLLDQSAADYDDPYNWPRSLAKRLVARGKRVVVLNGGVAGYNSNQELLKLLRDVLPMNPDLVLTLDGVNEFQGHRIDRFPMLHPYHPRLMNAALRPSTSRLFPNFIGAVDLYLARDRGQATGVTFGIPNSRGPADQWAANVRTEHAVCTEFDTTFVTYLQPVFGYGAYVPSDDIEELLPKYGDDYLPRMADFYSTAVTLCDNFEFCTSLIDVFANEPDVYLDARHQNERGVELLVDAVVGDLERRGVL